MSLLDSTQDSGQLAFSPTATEHHVEDSLLHSNEGSKSESHLLSKRPTTTSRRNSNPRFSVASLHLRRAATSLLIPEKKVGPAPTFWRSLRSILCSSWLNILLVFIPVSWALHFATPDKDTPIFIFSFLAIIPLAKLLAFATDELSIRVGQTLAGLLNATLGNAVELIVAIIALTQCKLHIVQSSLVGSVLSNLLLVLGMCFFAGGVRFSEQGFGAVASQLNSSLLTISVIAVLLPAAFYLNTSTAVDSDEGQDILKVSHGVAIILLFIYGSYLFFQLYSHAALYTDERDIIKSTKYAPRPKKSKKNKDSTSLNAADDGAHGVEMSFLRPGRTSDARSMDNMSGSGTIPASGRRTPTTDVESGAVREKREEEEEEEPQMSLMMTIGLLAVVTVLVAVTAEWLVDSIDGMTDGGVISQEFVGIILLPIVGNAAEHVTAVTVSVKDKLTLSLGVAVGSSIQIALFVIPFIVTLGWILGKPLTLLFDPYEAITMFLAVITVNYCVQDGKSNWLEGMILMCLYLILGVTFWFYPGSDPSGILNTCQ